MLAYTFVFLMHAYFMLAFVYIFVVVSLGLNFVFSSTSQDSGWVECLQNAILCRLGRYTLIGQSEKWTTSRTVAGQLVGPVICRVMSV